MQKLTEQMFEEVLAGVSKPLADEARAAFPGSADCYRLKDDSGHYFLIGFAPPHSFPEFVSPYDDVVTAVLIEGADSTSPGQVLVNVPLTQTKLPLGTPQITPIFRLQLRENNACRSTSLGGSH